MYNYPYYWQNMQQCNLNSSQFYRLESQNANCMQMVNEACTNVAFNLQQKIIEDIRKSYKDFPKSCHNCKHRHGTWCNKFQRYSSVASAPTALMGTGDCFGYRYWEPIKSVDDSLKDCCCETQNQQNPKNGSTKTSIAAELSQCKTNEENLEVARKHGLAIDLTKQENQLEKDLQTKIRIEELKRRIEQLEAQQLQTNFFKPFQPKEDTESYDKQTYTFDCRKTIDNDLSRDAGIRKTYEGENSRLVIIEDKPEKKYTVYDLYELVFPDDPIKAHFDAERKRIIEKYKKQEEVVEKISVPDMPKRALELIPTETDDGDMMTVLQAVAFWIGAIAFVVILILT